MSTASTIFLGLGALIVAVILLIAIVTALWKTFHDLLSKILGWVFSSVYGVIGLLIFFWLIFQFKR